MLRKITKARVNENIMAVIRFLSLCATRFASSVYFVANFSKKSNIFAMAIFNNCIKLNTSSANPMIIPSKMQRDRESVNDKLKLTSDRGSR